MDITQDQLALAFFLAMAGVYLAIHTCSFAYDIYQFCKWLKNENAQNKGQEEQ